MGILKKIQKKAIRQNTKWPLLILLNKAVIANPCQLTGYYRFNPVIL